MEVEEERRRRPGQGMTTGRISNRIFWTLTIHKFLTATRINLFNAFYLWTILFSRVHRDPRTGQSMSLLSPKRALLFGRTQSGRGGRGGRVLVLWRITDLGDDDAPAKNIRLIRR